MTELAVIQGGLSQLPADTRDSILQDAIDRYSKGESAHEIAVSHGIDVNTLYRHLIEHREADWRTAKISLAIAELDKAEQDLKRASDKLGVSRAREEIRSRQWQLERLFRRIYGQDQPASGHAAVQINIGIRRQDAQVIESLDITTDSQSVAPEK